MRWKGLAGCFFRTTDEDEDSESEPLSSTFLAAGLASFEMGSLSLCAPCAGSFSFFCSGSLAGDSCFFGGSATGLAATCSFLLDPEEDEEEDEEEEEEEDDDDDEDLEDIAAGAGGKLTIELN